MSEWSNRFASAISATLESLRDSVGETPLAMLAIDCHPWNGGLYIAILKQSEVESDPNLGDPEEMASWDLYDCADSLDEWSSVVDLAEEMESAYRENEDPSVVAEDYMKLCVRALKSDRVQAAVATFQLGEGFRFSVAHPDTGHEYYE